MNANIMQHVLDDLSPFRIEPFGIFRQRGEGEPLHFLGTAATMSEAQAKASASMLHKDTLFVHQNDPRTGKQCLHAFKVRQGQAGYRRNPQTGLSERYHPLKLDALFSVPVDAFAPVRPFDAFADCPVGRDFALIEGKAA